MNQLEELISYIQQYEGGTREQYSDLMRKIIYHETGGTMAPDTVQKGGGPGRGLFQYEIGINQGADTAVNRLLNFYEMIDKKAPEWVKKLANKDSVNLATLPSWKQKMIFLGDKKMGVGDLHDVFTGKTSIEDFWVNAHWKGSEEDEEDRRESWSNDMKLYNKKYNSSNIAVSSELEGAPEVKRLKKSNTNNNFNIKNFKNKPSFLDDIVKNIKNNSKDNPLSFNNKNLNEFNTGGSHLQNPLGGIPQGKNNKGGYNTVEQGETSFNLPKIGKYIYSNNISTDGNIVSNNNKKIFNIDKTLYNPLKNNKNA